MIDDFTRIGLSPTSECSATDFFLDVRTSSYTSKTKFLIIWSKFFQRWIV